MAYSNERGREVKGVIKGGRVSFSMRFEAVSHAEVRKDYVISEGLTWRLFTER